MAGLMVDRENLPTAMGVLLHGDRASVKAENGWERAG
jgi:hypothetical protein